MRSSSKSRGGCNSSWPMVLKLALLFLLAIGGYGILRWVEDHELVNPERITALLTAAGPLAPVIFMLLMAAAVVITPIPSLPLDLAAGATFGVVLGTTYSVIGAETGAIFSFLIGRALGRGVLARLFRTDIRFCERCSDRHLAVFVFLARLLPIFSFDLISYGAGLTNMSVRAFAISTLLGMIPPTFALAYAGRSLVSGEWQVLLLGFVMVVFFLLVPKLVIRYHASRWVQLLWGEVPAVADQETQQAAAEKQIIGPVRPCSSCGGLMNDRG